MPWTTDMLTNFLPSRPQMSLVDTNGVGCSHRAHQGAHGSFLSVNKSGLLTSQGVQSSTSFPGLYPMKVGGAGKGAFSHPSHIQGTSLGNETVESYKVHRRSYGVTSR